MEVLKEMQDLEVAPDVETISTYVLPVFPSIDAARQAFKVALNALCVSVCVSVLTVPTIADVVGYLCSGCWCVFGVGGPVVFGGAGRG